MENAVVVQWPRAFRAAKRAFKKTSRATSMNRTRLPQSTAVGHNVDVQWPRVFRAAKRAFKKTLSATQTTSKRYN
jgi:hypothetical protein